MTAITQAAQGAVTGALVTMFQLDATMLGDTAIRYFSANSKPDASAIAFNGISYVPIDIDMNGFEWGGMGAPPTPTVKIANTSLLIGAMARDFGDLVGAEIRRIRTFADFLDDGATPDPAMKFPDDVFRVERKSSHNKIFLEFELAVPFDQEGVLLPARQCLRDACTHIYRYWNGTAFDTTRTTCPYAGTNYFNKLGEVVATAAEDSCGKRLSDCIKRFGAAPLPTRAFPGMQRFQT